MRVVISGGGTGGHVFPALAIAEALRDQEPGIDIHFVGTASGFENKAIPGAGEKLHHISSGGIVGKNPISRILGLAKAGAGVAQSLTVLRKLKPDIVVGTGGFVMAPVLLAARILGIPFVIQEQNSFPGLTTRKFSKAAKFVCIAYPRAAEFLPGSNTILTGNPLRKKILQIAQERRTQDFALPTQILVTGGSLGAKSINLAVGSALVSMCEIGNVTWQYGRTGMPDSLDDQTVRRLRSSGRLIADAFFDDMPVRFQNADIVLSRAGAMTLSEIAVFGLPSILVPFPQAAHDHQTANAKSVAEAGAALVIKDRDISGDKLLDAVRKIVSDKEQYLLMSNSMKSLGRPTAAKDIASLVLETASQ